jgi:hypothetical protein
VGEVPRSRKEAKVALAAAAEASVARGAVPAVLNRSLAGIDAAVLAAEVEAKVSATVEVVGDEAAQGRNLIHDPVRCLL